MSIPKTLLVYFPRPVTHTNIFYQVLVSRSRASKASKLFSFKWTIHGRMLKFSDIGFRKGSVIYAVTPLSDAYNPLGVMNLKLWLQFLLFLIADVFSYKISSGEKSQEKLCPGGPQSGTLRFGKKYFCHFELQYHLILKW